jgi:DNA-binding response OmpR family regulator
MSAGIISAATGSSSGNGRPILIVDDDRKFVDLVRVYLEREGYPVICAFDGAEALAQVDRESPRLVILDLMLPEVDGLSVLRSLRERGDVPIVMLSARGSTADRVLGIHEGADDYLAKPFSPAELVVRVKAVLRRSGSVERRSPASPIVRGQLTLDLERHRATMGGQALALTTVELRLLAALLLAEGRVLSRERLLAYVRLDPHEVLDRTIDVHIARLREKLGDDAENPRFIATVRGAGYQAVVG